MRGLTEVPPEMRAGLWSVSSDPESARHKGRIGGRRPRLSDKQQVEIVRMIQSGGKTAAADARLFNIHPATVCRLMARQPVHGK